MQESIDTIVNKISFHKKQLFGELLKKCIKNSEDSCVSTYTEHENAIFKVNDLFKGFPSFINEHGKDRKYEAGVEALTLICEELGIEIEKEECFILFHLRDLGKFRMKETTLHEELKELWKTYKHYALEDREFSYALKSLMRNRFINYRKGNLHLNKIVLIRYRTNYH